MARIKYAYVRGFKKTERNLNMALKNMKVNTVRGLTEVGEVIHRDADLTPPTIPVEYGNLRQSRFVVNSRGKITMGKHPAFVDTPKVSSAGLMSGHKRMVQELRTKAMKSRHPKVYAGYSAWYAIYPHEMGEAFHTGKQINWTRPGSGSKFFQTAIMRQSKMAKGILYKHVNIRGKIKPMPIKGVKYGATIRTNKFGGIVI